MVKIYYYYSIYSKNNIQIYEQNILQWSKNSQLQNEKR